MDPKFVKKEIICQIENLQQVRRKCLMSSSLNGQQIKNFFVKIIDQIKKPSYGGQVIDSVINKLVTVGNKNQTLENKFQDLRESMERSQKQRVQMKDLFKNFKKQVDETIKILDRRGKQNQRIFDQQVQNLTKFTKQQINKIEQNILQIENRLFEFIEQRKDFRNLEKEDRLKPIKKEQVKRILQDLQEIQKDKNMKLVAEVMNVKPNKALGINAGYENVKIQFNRITKKITFQTKNNKIQAYTLLQIRWITKDMRNIQLILKQGISKVIKLEAADVARWVEPVCKIMDLK